MINLDVNAVSDVGMVRDHNEDTMLVASHLLRDSSITTKGCLNPTDRYIVAIADGMGGHNAGEVASAKVASDLSAYFRTIPSGLTSQEFMNGFHQWILDEHDSVVRFSREEVKCIGMGTTLVSLMIYENRIFWLNCGDSRLYRFRGNCLNQISKDHSFEGLGGAKGYSHLISNSIGAGSSVYIDMFEITDCVFSGDLFLLCSDGLSDMLTDDEIEKLLSIEADSIVLMKAAKAAAGTDNISVCLARFEMK